MAVSTYKRSKVQGKYKYVNEYVNHRGEIKYVVRIPALNFDKEFKGEGAERTAAKSVDMALINRGKSPVNILKAV